MRVLAETAEAESRPGRKIAAAATPMLSRAWRYRRVAINQMTIGQRNSFAAIAMPSEAAPTNRRSR